MIVLFEWCPRRLIDGDAKPCCRRGTAGQHILFAEAGEQNEPLTTSIKVVGDIDRSIRCLRPVWIGHAEALVERRLLRGRDRSWIWRFRPADGFEASTAR